MKHLQSYNERYTRTVGFRYSEPKIEMELVAIFNGELDNDILKGAFDEFRIKTGEIEISDDFKELGIEIPDDFDGWFIISFFVYNDRKYEMNSLIEDIGDYLSDMGILIKVVNLVKR